MHKMLARHRFEASTQEVARQLRMLQLLSLTYQTDLECALVQEDGELLLEIHSDDPLLSFPQGIPKKLQGIEGMTKNQDPLQKIVFSIYSSGRMEPLCILGLRAGERNVWVDLRFPPQIKHLTAYPTKSPSKAPDHLR